MGTTAPTYNGGLTSMTLHEFIILMTLPIGTSGYNEIQLILPIGTSRYNIRYTSECIPNLQIHQLILGKHQVKDMDVYLEPLIDEILNYGLVSICMISPKL